MNIYFKLTIIYSFTLLKGQLYNFLSFWPKIENSATKGFQDLISIDLVIAKDLVFRILFVDYKNMYIL